jgi:hypothetical protein
VNNRGCGVNLFIVVGKFRPDPESFKGPHNVYFSPRNIAGGLLEGIGHHQFAG